MQTGQSWLEYIVDDRGYYRNLMNISQPFITNELINIALTSTFLDEVYVAVTRLKIEAEEKEFRQELIDKINLFEFENLSNLEKQRLLNIIQTAELTNKLNRRNIVGKHIKKTAYPQYASLKLLTLWDGKRRKIPKGFPRISCSIFR